MSLTVYGARIDSDGVAIQLEHQYEKGRTAHPGERGELAVYATGGRLIGSHAPGMWSDWQLDELDEHAGALGPDAEKGIADRIHATPRGQVYGGTNLYTGSDLVRAYARGTLDAVESVAHAA